MMLVCARDHVKVNNEINYRVQGALSALLQVSMRGHLLPKPLARDIRALQG